jgi:hypothetical protein
MLAIAIGVVLAVFIALLSRLTHFERDRSYFAVILIAIATYYVLFACMANEAIMAEVFVASIFAFLAICGALRWPLLLGIGIFMHGIFDLVHNNFISNSGVPLWWPMFCASIDMVLGTWVIYLVKTKRV